MVEGHVPDRSRLLLHAVLPAGDRSPRRRSPVPAGYAPDRCPHAPGNAADVPQGRPREPARTGVRGHAGKPPAVLAGEALCPDPARIRGDILDHHHHALVGRCHRAHAGEPLPPRVPRRTGRAHHRGPAADTGRRVPARIQRSRRRGHSPGGGLPAPERCGHPRRAWPGSSAIPQRWPPGPGT